MPGDLVECLCTSVQIGVLKAPQIDSAAMPKQFIYSSMPVRKFKVLGGGEPTSRGPALEGPPGGHPSLFSSCTFRTFHPHCGARFRIQTPFLANLHNVAKLTLDTEGRRAGHAGQQGPRSQAQGGLHVSCRVLGYEVEVSSLRKHALFQSWLLDLGVA